jgi:hypothetical protein
VSWLSAAVEEVSRRRAADDERVLAEVRLLRTEVERFRAEAAADRSWTHLGVEMTWFAVGVALATLPHAGMAASVEALLLMMVGAGSAVVTVLRWFMRAHPT